MNEQDENTYVEILDIIDADTGRHIAPNMDDEHEYEKDMMKFMDLIGETGMVEENPAIPNGYVARNKRVGLDIYFVMYHGAA